MRFWQMKVMEINSSKNELFKDIYKLKQKKYRYRSNSFLIEGIKLVKHAAKQCETIEYLMFCQTLIAPEIIEEILTIVPETTNVLYLPKDLFEDISDTVNSQGVIAIVQIPKAMESLKANGLYIALDRIQDPGNLGTIIRTADAAGFDGLIYNKGTVDPYGEKVLRSTMGSIFSLPLLAVENLAETLATAKLNGTAVFCTSLEDSEDYSEANYQEGAIIVIGNESQGVSEEVFEQASQKIKIPIYGQAESLNAAIAAAVIMYEAVKGRK